MADADAIFNSLSTNNVHDDEEPDYYILRNGEPTGSHVYWHVDDEKRDPDQPEHGGWWHFSDRDGTEEDWREIPRPPEGGDEACNRAMGRVADRLANDED